MEPEQHGSFNKRVTTALLSTLKLKGAARPITTASMPPQHYLLSKYITIGTSAVTSAAVRGRARKGHTTLPW